MRAPGLSFAGRSLLFAVMAGLAAIPVLMVAAPLVGFFWAWTVVSLGAAILYVTTVSPSWSRALPAALLATFIAIVVGVFATTPSEIALGMALVVGVCRSGLLYRRRGLRSLAVELGLLAGGLLFARFLGGSSPLSAGLGLWGFFLVQSLFFVVSGWEAQAAGEQGRDSFDEAERRVMEVLRSVGPG